jgi:hypothetical protein
VDAGEQVEAISTDLIAPIWFLMITAGAGVSMFDDAI